MATTLQRRRRRRCGRRQTRQIRRHRHRPPKPPKPPPNPPWPLPNGPTPLFHPLHGPPPQCRPPAPRVAADDEDQEEDEQDDLQRIREVAGRRPRAPDRDLARHILQLHVAPLGDPVDDARDARDAVPRPYWPSRNRGRIASRIVCPEKPSVTNPSSPYPTSIPTLRSSTATTISRPLSLPRSPMPRPLILEHLDRVFLDVGVRLKRRHGGDDDDVAAGVLQRVHATLDLALARRVDDVREVVDGCRSVPVAAAGRAPDARRTGTRRTG